jgi:hypothetical protein
VVGGVAVVGWRAKGVRGGSLSHVADGRMGVRIRIFAMLEDSNVEVGEVGDQGCNGWNWRVAKLKSKLVKDGCQTLNAENREHVSFNHSLTRMIVNWRESLSFHSTI